MILGMTGTRNSITDAQREWLSEQVKTGSELHHGACVGADAAAHRVAVQHSVQVVVHPPEDQRLAMSMRQLLSPRGGVAILSPKPYLDRNRDIVDECDRLLALPDGPEKPHGGTWYTVRYAMSADVPVLICYPGGAVEPRYPAWYDECGPATPTYDNRAW